MSRISGDPRTSGRDDHHLEESARGSIGTSLSDRARTVIEDLIHEGQLLPGSALDERALAEQFGMSRTPVREAIQQLQVQGLVRVVPRHGAFVAKLSVRELLGMLELLAELEASCARFASRRISAAQKADLVKARDRCVEVAQRKDFADYDLANLAFHQILYEACNNRYLTDQILAIRRRVGIYRRNLFEKTGRIAVSAAEHLVISDAVMAGDERAAADAARGHIVIGGPGFAEFISTIPAGLLAD